MPVTSPALFPKNSFLGRKRHLPDATCSEKAKHLLCDRVCPENSGIYESVRTDAQPVKRAKLTSSLNVIERHSTLSQQTVYEDRDLVMTSIMCTVKSYSNLKYLGERRGERCSRNRRCS